MGKWLGAVAVAAVLAAGGPAARPARADDNMNPGASCSPSGTSLALTAQDHKFDKDCLAVPAGQAFTIRFDNKDNDRHSVAILPSHMSTETFFQGDIVPGPKSVTYSVPALKAGTFHFHCQIHPNLMNGTFVVAATPAAAAPAPTPPPATSMGGGMPAASPAPAPAPVPKTASAAPPQPAPVAGPAPGPSPSDMPMPGPARAAAIAPRTAPAARPDGLPRSGPASNRLMLLLAGIALVAGGLSIVGGARRPRPVGQM